jgi:hypothetical protein
MSVSLTLQEEIRFKNVLIGYPEIGKVARANHKAICLTFIDHQCMITLHIIKTFLF